MTNKTPTQEEINESFIEIKEEWERMINCSGQTKAVFIATSKEATGFLAMYQEFKEVVEGMGLEMPVLEEGLTIKLH